MTREDFTTTSLPFDHPTTSYWQEEAKESEIHNYGKDMPLPSSNTDPVDVVIIGSGISGAVAAYMLQNGGEIGKGKEENKPSIAMLEARQACSGATGRNGGHCRPDTFAGFTKYSSLVGEEEAEKVLQNEWETFELIEEIIQTERLDCDWWKGRTLGVYRNEDTLKISKANFDTYQKYLENLGKQLKPGVRFITDEKQAREISRVKDAVGVAIWPAGSLHPLRFVHELLKHCLKQSNFSLYTHTPALEIKKDQSKKIWHVITPRGSLRARNVLLATNGYSTKLLPDLQSVLLPHRAQCSAISPPTDFRDAMALNSTCSIIKAPGDYEYLTQQPSNGGPNPAKALKGRIGSGAFILGGGHPHAPRQEQVGTFDDTVILDSITEHLQTFPENTFVDWKVKEGQLTHIWTGIQGYTRDSLPLVGSHYGQDQEGLFLNLGHHGHGMARAASCSRGVARLILNKLKGTEEDTVDRWETVTQLPSCYRWSKERATRKDIDCREDF